MSSHTELSRSIADRIAKDEAELKREFGPPDPKRVRCCVVDDLVPSADLASLLDDLPALSEMKRLQNRKERKYVCAKLDHIGPTIRSLVVAFNSQPVADAIARVMGKTKLEIDTNLYNGGVTAMAPDDFMCPHLDNSHDYHRVRRREVVVLYYLSAHWRPEFGGHLELWDENGRSAPRRIDYKSNRLVVMETTDQSWHSITKIVAPTARLSLTSYYYAPATEVSPLRLTRFTAWPGHPVQGAIFNAEFHLRSIGARVLGARRPANQHVYRTEPSQPRP